MMGAINSAQSVARLSFAIGVLLMLLSFGWGGYILYRQKQNLD